MSCRLLGLKPTRLPIVQKRTYELDAHAATRNKCVWLEAACVNIHTNKV